VSGESPPGRPISSRRALAASIAALVAVTAGFAWLAVKSYDLLHHEVAVTNLKPVRITGPEEVVFDWSKDACDGSDFPDAPVHAFRDVRKNVHLIAGNDVTRQFVGPELGDVKRRCRAVMSSANDPDPSRFAYKEWIFGTYTDDGKTLFALVHDEFHGDEVPGLCPSGVFQRCWYNAVTLARSDDGGASFHHALPPPGHLIAAAPYRYEPDAGRVGILQPSDIIR
jgi:hypothetical protein